HYTIEHANQSLPRAMLAALGFHLNWYEGQTGLLPASWGVLWSLSIEELFYIALPLLCLFVRRTWLLVLLLLALAISLPWTRAALAGNEVWQEKAYLPGMAAIATGVLAAIFVSRTRPRGRRWTRALAVVGSLGIGTMIFADDFLWRALGQFNMLTLTASSACLVIAAYWHVRSGPSRPAAITRWIGSFGRLSYEIYLTHMFVVFSIFELFQASGGNARFTPIWYAAAVALCWALGRAVDGGLSTPCNRAIRNRLIAQPSA
ncbi:MAG: acyltransferase family protein, partial [Steroidobacteraceae bacterium]